MSRTLDLHPLSITFMVLVMGALFGVVGAVLAVPTAVIVKTLYEELYLTAHVSDPEALEAQSERVLSDGASRDRLTFTTKARTRTVTASAASAGLSQITIRPKPSAGFAGHRPLRPALRFLKRESCAVTVIAISLLARYRLCGVIPT